MLRSTLRIATRSSVLALWQANFVAQQLKQHYPKLEIELVEITTTGDKIQDKPLASIGGKGLFVKALEEALQAKQADFAVHSLKDVPPELPGGFTLAAFLERENPLDALVSNKFKNLEALPSGAVVASCSVRRKAELAHLRPDLIFKDIRGNVDTRLRKLDLGEFDALILAAAGLKRLGLEHRISQIFPKDQCLPSVGQGVLAVECLSENMQLRDMLQVLNHKPTELCVIAERSMNLHLNANCFSPVGSYAEVQDNQIVLTGWVMSQDGTSIVKTVQKGPMQEADMIGVKAAEDLLANGASQYL